MTSPRSVWQSTGRNLLRIVPLLIVLALWQLASATGVLPKSLMPSLREVGAALVGLIASGEIVPHTIASLGRAGAGFFIAVVFGIAIGVLMARVHSVQLALEPILGLIYPVPKPALIPLFMFDTALTRGEIVAAVRMPGGPAGAGTAYEKLSLVAGDFAILSVAAIAGKDVCVAIGGYAMKPVPIAGLDAAGDVREQAALALRQLPTPPDDQRASAGYRRRVAPELVRRAVAAALKARDE